MKLLIILLLIFLIWVLNNRYSKLLTFIRKLLEKNKHQLPNEFILDTQRISAAAENKITTRLTSSGYDKMRQFNVPGQVSLNLFVRDKNKTATLIDLLTKGEEAEKSIAQAEVDLDGGEYGDIEYNYYLLFPEQQLNIPVGKNPFTPCNKTGRKTGRDARDVGDAADVPTTDDDVNIREQYDQKQQKQETRNPRRQSNYSSVHPCLQITQTPFSPANTDPDNPATQGTNAPPIRIALIDSRSKFDGDLAVFQEALEATDPYAIYLNAAGNDFGTLDLNRFDDHGTFMASIIAQQYEGDRVLKIRNYPFHDGQSGHLMEVICAIYGAVEAGVDIINLSLGYPDATPNHHLRRAMQYAQSKDVLVICAAGNLNSNNDTNPYWPSGFSHLSNVVSAAAVRSNGTLWTDSAHVGSNYGVASVTLATNGVETQGIMADGSRKSLTGTSSSAARLSAMAATIKSDDPSITNAVMLKEALINRIDPAGEIFPVPPMISA